MRIRVSWCLAGVLAMACVQAGLGQTRPSAGKTGLNETAQKLREATSTTPLMWNVQTIIDRYVQHMTRYYDLTEKQEQYTRELLTQRVKQFLKDYEKDTRILFGEYYEYQLRGEMPTAEAAKEFARRAAPLVEAIKQEILDGNMQWRRILNEEQQKKHDQDLELMKREFDRYDQMFQRWAEGNVQPVDVGIRSQRVIPPPSINLEDAMTLYVRRFTNDYSLDAGQKQTAQSILREALDEAARYREAHKQQFEEIAAQQKALTASNPKNDTEELKRAQAEGRKLTARKMELEKPLTEQVFNRLKTRLQDVPTADQRKQYQVREEALLAKFRPSTRPAGATQPAGAPANAAVPSTAPSAARQ